MFMYADSDQNKFNVYEKEKKRLQFILEKRILCQDNSRARATKT